jgi:TPR repeat protein
LIYFFQKNILLQGCDSYYLSKKEKSVLINKSKKGDLNSIQALYNFHFINCNGDKTQALKWLREAAKFGSDREYYNLGNYLISFNEKETNLYKEGISWLKKSANLGNKDAQIKLTSLVIKEKER